MKLQNRISIYRVIKDSIFEDCSFYDDASLEISLKLGKIRKSFLPLQSTQEVQVLLLLKTRQIDFSGIVEKVGNYLRSLTSNKNNKVKCSWPIIGSGSGIYLYEELIRNYNKNAWNNVFSTIDLDNGKTFFDFESLENDRISKVLEDSLMNVNNEDSQILIGNVVLAITSIYDYLWKMQKQRLIRIGKRRKRPTIASSG